MTRPPALPSLALALAVVLGLAPACLEPLPDPTTCEPPAKVIDDACVPCDPPKQFVEDTCMICPPAALVPYSQCLPSAFVKGGHVPANGCLAADGQYDRFSCLTGDRACSCDAGGEEEPGPACFAQAGDCPEAVRRVSPNAVCYPVAPTDVEPTDLGGVREGCACGCYEAIARCDGVGMAFGMFSDGTNPGPIAFEGARLRLGDRLPSSGTFGVYVRARGFASPVVVTPHPSAPVRSWMFFVTSDFVEQVAYGPDQDGVDPDFGPNEPYHYDGLGRPTEVRIATQTAKAESDLLAIYEVDCVIPFVVPDPD